MLVGLAGAKRSGKDTVADYLVRDRGFIKYALAEPLKRACRALFDFSEDQVLGDAKDVPDLRYGQTPRAFLQMLGTEFVRDRVGCDFFVDRFRDFHSRHPGADIVVSDVRFQNEIDAIRSLGGTVVLLSRAAACTCNHRSEDVATLDVDHRVSNDGSVAELRAAVERCLRPQR